jgi:hypothetical protein
VSWGTDRLKDARGIASGLFKKGVTLFLVGIIILTALVELNIPPDFWDQSPYFLLILIAAMIFFLKHDVAASHEDLTAKVAAKTDEMKETAIRIEATQQNIDSAVTRLATNAELMRQTLNNAGQLRSLEGSMADLKALVGTADSSVTLKIEHLGLNMSTAWDRLCPALKEFAQTRQVLFHLLIMGREAAGGQSPADGGKIAVPKNVEPWLGQGDLKRADIIEALEKMQAELPGKLQYEVRSYRDLPIVHGVRISGPFDAAYVAFSRWDEKKESADPPYWWGGDEYHRIGGADSAERLDLIKIFDGYFERWWTMNASSSASGPTAPVAAAALGTTATKP